MNRFNRLYKLIMQEVDDYNFSDEQKQVVLNVMKTLLDEKDFNDWKEYIDQICEEMYNNHHYMKYQIEHLDKMALRAILDDVEQGWLDPHEQYVPEYEESVKADTSKKVIKEDVNDKVEQYKADIQAYLDKGDGEQNDGFDGYVDEDDFYTTLAEICAQNKDKVKALDEYLMDFVKSVPGGDTGDSTEGSLGLYQDIVEGNLGYSKYNSFDGLTDPETFTSLGFNVGEELAVLLKAHYVDVNTGADGSFWEGYGNDWADERAAGELEDIGLNGVVNLIEAIHDGEYDQDDEQDDQDWEPEEVPTTDEKLDGNTTKTYIEWFTKMVQEAADEAEIAYTVSLLDGTEEAFNTAIAQGKLTTAGQAEGWINQYVQSVASK